MAGSINRVILVGNLTRDPELRALPSGTSVCSLRLAVNDRIKDKNTGQWTDYANYFDITVFGQQAERYAEWLSKGRQIAVDGRLRWSEWQTQDGQKRSKVEVIADNVQFTGPREGGQSSGGQSYSAKVGADIGGSVEPGGPPKEDFIEDDDIPF